MNDRPEVVWKKRQKIKRPAVRQAPDRKAPHINYELSTHLSTNTTTNRIGSCGGKGEGRHASARWWPSSGGGGRAWHGRASSSSSGSRGTSSRLWRGDRSHTMGTTAPLSGLHDLPPAQDEVVRILLFHCCVELLICLLLMHVVHDHLRPLCLIAP